MAQDPNPYAAPVSRPGGPGVARSDTRADLRKIASSQRGIMLCILANVAIFAAAAVVPALLVNAIGFEGARAVQLGIGVSFWVLAVVQAVMIFRLASAVYSTGVGVLMVVLAFVPCVNLIGLLVISGRATNILKMYGYKVGLLGADMRQFPEAG